jgi:6-phosphogluconolactonase
MSNSMNTDFPGELRISKDAGQFAQTAAELFVELAEKSIQERKRFRVALTGGTTPSPVYKLLGTEAFSKRVDWDKVDLFWGDERYVAPDDPESNYRMTVETLLRRVPVPKTNIHRIMTEISPPGAAASAYEVIIRQCFGEASGVPRFDLIYLGLGTNGHCASLFPHSPALHENSRLVLADFVTSLNSWRISMSAILLNRGRTVAFMVTGQHKAQVLHDVLCGPRDPELLPAQLIAPEGTLLWLVDEAAATQIPKAGQERKSA